ncbi:unnamed protein product [Rhizophagus irregularis]|nr:unnamed protein product [Rhizophagus irregularis]
MAPRPSYGILLGGISQMAAPDQFGNPKVFEFVEYADTDSVLRALRVLGGEGSGGDKKVNSDENTRKYLAQYEASRPGTVHDTEIEEICKFAKLAHRTSPATEIKTEHGEKDDDTDLPADLPPDQKDLLSRTCCSKRTRALEKRENEQIVELKLKKKENVHMKGESRRESYSILDDKEEEQRR